MRTVLPRLVQATIVTLAVGALSLNSLSAAPLVAPKGEVTDPPVLQTWELAAGGKVEASLVGYSLQSRIITLQNKEGSTAHIAPPTPFSSKSGELGFCRLLSRKTK